MYAEAYLQKKKSSKILHKSSQEYMNLNWSSPITIEKVNHRVADFYKKPNATLRLKSALTFQGIGATTH